MSRHFYPVYNYQDRSLTGQDVGLTDGPPALVWLQLKSPIGNSGVYEMTPEKARVLARHLTALADLLDPPPSPESALREQVAEFVADLPGRAT